MTKAEQKKKVLEFISRGSEIAVKEYNTSGLYPRISGPLFEKWMNEINIFSERYLKDHPLQAEIHTTYFHHKTQMSSHKYMMGHLDALASDSEYWQDESPELDVVQPVHSHKGEENTMIPIIFISHRSTDAEVADMLRDYLVATGIPNEYIFCSSLPGNDVAQSISREVKEKIANSTVNIAILSEEYYKSAYCLNEAGIIWLQEPNVPAVVIGLPEITHTNMYGFLSSDYKLRRLDSATDISAIYDAVRAAVGATPTNVAVAVAASQKLSTRYAEYLTKRVMPVVQVSQKILSPSLIDDITTDDERVVLYYILAHKVRRVQKSDIQTWMTENEIYDVNVDNAFDLLASLGTGTYENETLNMDVAAFRKYTANADELMLLLRPNVEAHQSLSRERFLKMWAEGVFTDEDKLFIAYIVQNRVTTLGARWKETEQIDSIRQWELNNLIDGSVASTYEAHLNQFVENRFVYASEWTGYNNVRQYSICPSLKKLLQNFPYTEDLITVIEAHKDIPLF